MRSASCRLISCIARVRTASPLIILTILRKTNKARWLKGLEVEEFSITWMGGKLTAAAVKKHVGEEVLYKAGVAYEKKSCGGERI